MPRVLTIAFRTVLAAPVLFGLSSLRVAADVADTVAQRTLCATLERFGGGSDGRDNTEAFAAWARALAGTRGDALRCLALGAGRYLFRHAATVAVPPGTSIVIQGRGSGITQAVFPTNDGIAVTMTSMASSVSVTGLSLQAGRAAGGTAVAATNTQCLGNHPSNRFDDLEIRGMDGVAHWDRGLHLANLSTVHVGALNVYGPSSADGTTGLDWHGTPAPAGGQICWGIALDVNRSNFYGTRLGLRIGAFVQGLLVSRSNFTNGVAGIATIAAPDGSNDLDVSQSQFATSGPAIRLSGLMSDSSIQDNLFYVAKGQVGVWIDAARGRSFRIQNNQFTSAGGEAVDNTAIRVSGGTDGTVSGNKFSFLAKGEEIAPDLGWTIYGNSARDVAIPAAVGRGNGLGAGAQ